MGLDGGGWRRLTWALRDEKDLSSEGKYEPRGRVQTTGHGHRWCCHWHPAVEAWCLCPVPTGVGLERQVKECSTSCR